MSASHLPLAHDAGDLIQSPSFRRVLLRAWMVFLTLSVTYCYAYAWVVDGPFAANLLDALRCVAYDWLIWAVVSPGLIARTHRHAFDTAQSWTTLVRLLLITTLILGSFRIVLESLAGELTALQIAVIYLPRYLFIGAFILIGALLHRRLNNPARVPAAKTPWVVDSQPAASDAQPAHLPGRDRQPDHLIVTKGAAKVVLPIAEILCVSASGSNYLDVHSKTQSYLMRGTIKGMEHRLASERFVRVHRSHMVRLDAIQSASRGNMEVRLTNGKTVRLGLSYLHHLPHFAREQHPRSETVITR